MIGVTTRCDHIVTIGIGPIVAVRIDPIGRLNHNAPPTSHSVGIGTGRTRTIGITGISGRLIGRTRHNKDGRWAVGGIERRQGTWTSHPIYPKPVGALEIAHRCLCLTAVVTRRLTLEKARVAETDLKGSHFWTPGLPRRSAQAAFPTPRVSRSTATRSNDWNPQRDRGVRSITTP